MALTSFKKLDCHPHKGEGLEETLAALIPNSHPRESGSLRHGDVHNDCLLQGFFSLRGHIQSQTADQSTVCDISLS